VNRRLAASHAGNATTFAPIGVWRQCHGYSHSSACRARLSVRPVPAMKNRPGGEERQADTACTKSRGYALGRSRTFNLRIKSPLLCQLSYECEEDLIREDQLGIRAKWRDQHVAKPTAGTCPHARVSGAPGGTRTPDPQLRRLSLYPAELLAQRPDRRSPAERH
jgi:hypothetical protein